MMETMEILLALEQCQMTYNLGKYNDAITVAMELIQKQGKNWRFMRAVCRVLASSCEFIGQ